MAVRLVPEDGPSLRRFLDPKRALLRAIDWHVWSYDYKKADDLMLRLVKRVLREDEENGQRLEEDQDDEQEALESFYPSEDPITRWEDSFLANNIEVAGDEFGREVAYDPGHPSNRG